MQFFTRQRYEALQEDDTCEAEEEWDRANREYARMLERDRGRLPDSARALFELPLHDGKLEKVEQPDHETLRLIVDASAGPRGPRGRFELLFSGVDPTTYRGPTPGDIWLYEEVHLADAGFALHVLLWRSELLVEASSVIVRRVDA